MPPKLIEPSFNSKYRDPYRSLEERLSAPPIVRENDFPPLTDFEVEILNYLAVPSQKSFKVGLSYWRVWDTLRDVLLRRDLPRLLNKTVRTLRFLASVSDAQLSVTVLDALGELRQPRSAK